MRTTVLDALVGAWGREMAILGKSGWAVIHLKAPLSLQVALSILSHCSGLQRGLIIAARLHGRLKVIKRTKKATSTVGTPLAIHRPRSPIPCSVSMPRIRTEIFALSFLNCVLLLGRISASLHLPMWGERVQPLIVPLTLS